MTEEPKKPAKIEELVEDKEKKAEAKATERTSGKQNGEKDGKQPQARGSPFLSSQPPKATEQEGNRIDEELTAKKQHEDIQKMMSDNSLFSSTCKLYFMSRRSKQYEPRGEGIIMIVKDKIGMYKVVMMRDQIMLSGCNHYISKACPLVKSTKVQRSYIWVAINDECDALDKGEQTTYFATFHSDEAFEKFGRMYAEGQEKNAKIQKEILEKMGTKLEDISAVKKSEDGKTVTVDVEKK